MAIGLGIILAVLALASQLALPPLADRQIADRLTAGGGTASVSVSAFPAARLLFGDGGRISVTGSGLNLGLADGQDTLGRLDGFGTVNVSLDSFRAGPLAVRSFELTRTGGDPYHLVADATTTGAGLASYGAERLGLPSGPLAGFLEGALPGAGRPIPIHLDVEIRSDDGRAVVVGGGATVAGVPTGPLAELVTSAIAVRL
jgi:hypothetical protein